MGLSIKVLDCNGQCRSCYENDIRRVRGKEPKYDIDAILRTLREETLRVPHGQRGNAPCVHGGEPLLFPVADLEKILQTVHELYGRTNIQTNGTLITARHVELFRKYETSVGVSIDGDTWQLNRGRWNASTMTPDQIQGMTDLVMDNMRKISDAGLSLSVIALLRKYNAIPPHLDDFIRFLFRLKDEYGMNSVRTNEAIVFDPAFQKEEQLTPEELGNAFCRIADVCLADPKIQWLPYRDVIDLLLGFRDATCVFTECDVWKTSSEMTIDAFGNIGSCLKNGGARDGFQVLADSEYGRERYEALFQIPQELSGCKGCEWWFICKGGCPGAATDNDWRKRTRFCEGWRMLFSHIAKKLKALLPNLYTANEFYPAMPDSGIILSTIAQSAWQYGRRKNLETMKTELAEKSGQVAFKGHGDGHGDRPHGDSSGHGDRPHGDKPHGDSGHNDEHGDRGHGDHWDAGGTR